MIGELSEFAPYNDSCKPLATEEEGEDYNERAHRQKEEEQQFQLRYSVLSWNVDLCFLFSNFNISIVKS